MRTQSLRLDHFRMDAIIFSPLSLNGCKSSAGQVSGHFELSEFTIVALVA